MLQQGKKFMKKGLIVGSLPNAQKFSLPNDIVYQTLFYTEFEKKTL